MLVRKAIMNLFSVCENSNLTSIYLNYINLTFLFVFVKSSCILCRNHNKFSQSHLPDITALATDSKEFFSNLKKKKKN